MNKMTSVKGYIPEREIKKDSLEKKAFKETIAQTKEDYLIKKHNTYINLSKYSRSRDITPRI